MWCDNDEEDLTNQTGKPQDEEDLTNQAGKPQDSFFCSEITDAWSSQSVTSSPQYFQGAYLPPGTSQEDRNDSAEESTPLNLLESGSFSEPDMEDPDYCELFEKADTEENFLSTDTFGQSGTPDDGTKNDLTSPSATTAQNSAEVQPDNSMSGGIDSSSQNAHPSNKRKFEDSVLEDLAQEDLVQEDSRQGNKRQNLSPNQKVQPHTSSDLLSGNHSVATSSCEVGSASTATTVPSPSNLIIPQVVLPATMDGIACVYRSFQDKQKGLCFHNLEGSKGGPLWITSHTQCLIIVIRKANPTQAARLYAAISTAIQNGSIRIIESPFIASADETIPPPQPEIAGLSIVSHNQNTIVVKICRIKIQTCSSTVGDKPIALFFSAGGVPLFSTRDAPIFTKSRAKPNNTKEVAQQTPATDQSGASTSCSPKKKNKKVNKSRDQIAQERSAEIATMINMVASYFGEDPLKQ